MTIRKIDAYGASLGANTFTGAQAAPSLALGGATIGSNALAVTGTTLFTGNVDSTGYTNTSTAFQAAAAGSFYWNARSLMASPSDGVIKLSNNGLTDFSRLQFGGTTSSFPAIKRNLAALDVRLADDSAYATINALNFIASTYVQASTSGSFYIGANGSLSAPSDGVWALKNNAGSGFTGLTMQTGASTAIGWYTGTGSPESVVTARIGSIFSRQDGGAATSFYVKESGTGNTGWVGK
jgi:hypothetical protein